MTKTQHRQRTWYSKQERLTLKSLIDRIGKQKSMNPIDTGVILSELYINGDSKGLLELRKTVVDMEKGFGENPEDVADCKLFLLSQIANGYLTDINNISYRYIEYHAFAEGEVTDFYKRTTGFDPVVALPLANSVFGGGLHPGSKSKLEEM